MKVVANIISIHANHLRSVGNVSFNLSGFTVIPIIDVKIVDNMISNPKIDFQFLRFSPTNEKLLMFKSFSFNS